jgi:hypothetical protein
MGNDDALSDKDTLADLNRELEFHHPIAAAITNYQELPTKRQYRRMTTTGIVGAGMRTAAETFRHYSFVSGIVLDGPRERALATDACDGGEMYQMYLGSRLVAEGGRFLAIERVCIDKDIQVPGQVVDSYRMRERIHPCPIESRPLPMGRILETVALGMRSVCEGKECDSALARVAWQLYIFSYPFWIFEYRRVQSFNYALGVYLALRPSLTTKKARLRLLDYVCAWLIFIGVGAIAFIMPLRLFDALRSRLYAIAKRPLRLATLAKNVE